MSRHRSYSTCMAPVLVLVLVLLTVSTGQKVEKPPILTTAEWGGQPPLYTQRDTGIEQIVIHHEGGASNSGYTGAGTVRSIQNFHQGKGWATVGYHYLVGPDGVIYEGTPLGKRGICVYGNNENKLCICLIGNFEGIDTLEATQQSALTDLMAWIAQENLIENQLFPSLENVISVHRWVAIPGHGTACPGQDVVNKFPAIVSETMNKMRSAWSGDCWDKLPQIDDAEYCTDGANPGVCVASADECVPGAGRDFSGPYEGVADRQIFQCGDADSARPLCCRVKSCNCWHEKTLTELNGACSGTTSDGRARNGFCYNPDDPEEARYCNRYVDTVDSPVCGEGDQCCLYTDYSAWECNINTYRWWYWSGLGIMGIAGGSKFASVYSIKKAGTAKKEKDGEKAEDGEKENDDSGAALVGGGIAAGASSAKPRDSQGSRKSGGSKKSGGSRRSTSSKKSNGSRKVSAAGNQVIARSTSVGSKGSKGSKGRRRSSTGSKRRPSRTSVGSKGSKGRRRSSGGGKSGGSKRKASAPGSKF